MLKEKWSKHKLNYEGHKNTQEFLMEVKDELKENRK